MATTSYRWTSDEDEHVLEMVRVEGTNGRPYRFRDGDQARLVEVREFWLATVTVTQALWLHVMGDRNNPSVGRGGQLPLENISWDTIVQPDGFFTRINESPIRTHLLAQTSLSAGIFRLPTETEWEYAAQGGLHWRDGFRYSGSNDIDLVAGMTARAAITPTMSHRNNRISSASSTCLGTCGNGAKTRLRGTWNAFPTMEAHLTVKATSASFAAGVFIIGRCTAPFPSGMRSGITVTMAASGFGSLFPVSRRNRERRLMPTVSAPFRPQVRLNKRPSDLDST